MGIATFIRKDRGSFHIHVGIMLSKRIALLQHQSSRSLFISKHLVCEVQVVLQFLSPARKIRPSRHVSMSCKIAPRFLSFVDVSFPLSVSHSGGGEEEEGGLDEEVELTASGSLSS